jgi:hypothetical protein
MAECSPALKLLSATDVARANLTQDEWIGASYCEGFVHGVASNGRYTGADLRAQGR